MVDPEINDDLWEVLEPADFRDSVSKCCAAVLHDLAAKNVTIDATLVLSALHELDRGGQWPTQTPPAAFLGEVCARVPITQNWRLYAREVRQASMLWAIYMAGDSMLGMATAPGADAEEALAVAESRVLEIGERALASQAVPLAQAIHETIAGLQHRLDGRGGGISTTFAPLDQLLGGLRPGNLSVLAARPGRGKSTVAMQMAVDLAIAGHSVLFVSLEMSRTELCERILAAKAGVDSDRIRDGLLTQDDLQRIVDAQAAIADARLLIEDGYSRSMANIGALARRAKRRAGLELLVVDYVQLVRPKPGQQNRQEQIAEISAAMKGIARQVGVPVLMLAQLNREAEKDNKPPQLHHLRESGAIEQDADQVLMLHEPEDARGVLNVHVRKNRHGRCGTVSLRWHKSISRLEPMREEGE